MKWRNYTGLFIRFKREKSDVIRIIILLIFHILDFFTKRVWL